MHDDIAIRAEGLGKRYRLGHTVDLGRTFREMLQTLPLEITRRTSALLSRSGPSATGSDPEAGSDPDTPPGTFWAIRDFDLEVRRGEVLGIVGRNGAGKSTFLKILARITPPTVGIAELHGRVGSLLEVGTGFNPELSGRDNVYLNGSILGMRKVEIEKKFDEIVEFSEVEKFLDTPVKRYSSGMRVRLAFAVAAHLEPEILLVDEVLAVGDAKFQKKCIGKIKDVAVGGRTVLFVSHNMAAIERLCTRVIMLEQGRIAMAGSPHDVLARYMESDVGDAGEKVWENPKYAPGDHVARLRAVRLINSAGNISNQFSIRESFQVEVEFDVLEEGHLLDAGFYFHNAAGEIIFLVGDFQDERWRHEKRPAGRHRSRATIPADLLNEGVIRIEAWVSTLPYVTHGKAVDVLQIQLRDDLEEGGARGDFTKDWPGGPMRPLLDWEFENDPFVETNGR